MVDGFAAGADAVLAASIFHYGRYSVADVKTHLAGAGVPVRAEASTSRFICGRRRAYARRRGRSG